MYYILAVIFEFLIFFSFLQLDESLFVQIEVEQSIIVDDPDGAFTVTAFDANHCPGIYDFVLFVRFLLIFYMVNLNI